jgi:hypothetical protein
VRTKAAIRKRVTIIYDVSIGPFPRSPGHDHALGPGGPDIAKREWAGKLR